MYVIARTARGRPTLQHKLGIGRITTACGQEIIGWSRAYQRTAITEILCKKCGRLR